MDDDSEMWDQEEHDENERYAEHMWLIMKGVFRQEEPYPDDDWEQGYMDWDWSIRQGEPFPDDVDDDAARWLAENDTDV